MGHQNKIFSRSCFNNYLKICSVLLFIFITNTNLNSQTLTAEQIYEKVKDAVVVILAYDYSNELATQGSGVVLNDKGYVVTNYHVLSGNERLEIMHGDEIIPYVDIIGIDVEKDILILKIDEKKFPAVKIGDVKKLKVGQRVYAIGSPMGFENTISEGIISGLRSYEELSKNYIQITASISPGSSGGAVVNDKGELIGISTLTTNEGQNLNFAIPIDEVLNVKIDSYSKDDSYKDFEFFNKGYKAALVENYNDAIEFFTLFIELNPLSVEAYDNRGLAKYYLSDYLGAMADFNRAIEINSNKAKTYFNRGNVKNDLEDYRGAIQDYTKAIEINPNDADAFYNRGNAKNDLEDYRGAIQDFNKAIEMKPEDALAYYNRGVTNCNFEEYSMAIKDFNKAIELNPNDADAYYNRGFAKYKLENYRVAIQDYTKAIEINPNYANAYINRGIAKYRLEDESGACLDWSKAGELGHYQAYELIKEFCN